MTGPPAIKKKGRLIEPPKFTQAGWFINQACM